MNRKKAVTWGFLAAYALFILLSYLFEWDLGRESSRLFKTNLMEMAVILPCAFILIGLFEVWIKRETIEKHLGEGAGWKSFLWVTLLGGMTLGPMLTALPVASALWKKGAALSVVITYLGAAAVCRIPMTIFEASYLGIPFTVIRYVTALPLILVSSLVLSRSLKHHLTPRESD